MTVYKNSEIVSAVSNMLEPTGSIGLRFIQSNLEWFKKWREDWGCPDSSGTVLFACHASPGTIAKSLCNGLEPQRVYPLAYDFVLSGVIICNENLKKCFKVRELTCTGDAFEWIEKNSEKFDAMQIFTLSKSRSNYWIADQSEICDVESLQELQIAPTLNQADVNPDLIETEIQVFHKENLVQRGGVVASRIWQTEEMAKNKKRLIFCDHYESRVQSYLVIHFKSKWPNNIRVQEEAPDPGGRCDIHITRSLNSNQRVSKIEIKMLNPIKPEADNEKWAESGVIQVMSYGAGDPQTEAMILLIFDGRKDELKEDKYPKVAELASVNNVRWHLLPMFHTREAYFAATGAGT